MNPFFLKDFMKQSGNAFFLILIAVALFAALSYALSQSGRTSGGNASQDTNRVNASQLTQYPVSLKTAIMRMTTQGAIGVEDVIFNSPSDFGALTDPEKAVAVFYPTGGGAPYAKAPAEIMANGAAGTWKFNSENEVAGVGSDGATAGVDTESADVTAFLSGVTQAVCESMHTKLGLGAIPTIAAAVNITDEQNATTTGIAGHGTGAVLTDAVLDRSPYGCFQKPASTYVYYHVLIER